MKPLLVLVAAAGAAGWLALHGSTAVSPQVLTYSVDLPLPGADPFGGGLCTTLSDGSGRMRLTAPADVLDPAWSPDGRHVAYIRPVSEESGRHVFVANADGRGERRLTHGSRSLIDDPVWSPDGRQVAFTARSGQGVSQIALVDRSGSNRRTLSLSVPGNAAEPAWAPNGRQLAVTVRSQVRPAPPEVYLADVDGSAARLFATSAAEPTWSPDGSQIAYVGAGGLTVANVNGTVMRTVTADASSPAWSPDGRQIAFVRNDDLLVVRPDGSGERIVVPGPLPVQGPAWRPAADQAAGTNRPCVVEGTSRADVVRGTSSAEVIVGGSGSDTIFAGGGRDVVFGGSGHDFVSGEPGEDRLVGGFGRDRLYGGRGDDVLYSRDAQADALDGGPGHDAAFYDPGVVGATDRLRSVELRLGRP